MTREEVKRAIQENFDYLSQMSIPEYTLYTKWRELSNQTWTEKELKRIQHVKENLWMPQSPDDYRDLNIKVICADDADKLLTWRILRLFGATNAFNQNPGRNLRFYVVHEIPQQDPFGFGFDKPIHKYLGIICLGSDFISIGGRDAVIQWDKEHKLTHGRLKHTAMGSSIVPTQPLGYNYLGGKLISLMILSDTVEQAWNQKYGENLVGVTTTSLYGGYSQYNNLKYWKKCKSTNGEIALEPSEETYEILKEYCKEAHPEAYKSFVSPKDASCDGCSIPSHPKTKIMQKVFSDLKIRAPKNNAPRGVYWAALFKNTNEFLRMEHDEIGDRKFDNSVEALSNLWKEKYAKKRIEKLMADNRVDSRHLFYDDIKDMEWEEVKEKYLENVGR